MSLVKNVPDRQQYICKNCGHHFRTQAVIIQDAPNVLIFDVETSPMEVYVWGLYKQRINSENVIKDWFIISWSAKWLFSDEIMSEVLTPDEAIAGDDSRILKRIWHLFETANIVIAHNAKRFDVRKLNSRWMVHDFGPPSPYQIIDTLVESRKMAAHSSHKLDYLGILTQNKGKIETNYSLWKRCKLGEKEALKEMETYNRDDVRLLEDVYLFIRPWIKSHPNYGVYADSNNPVCPACGSEKLHPVDDYVTMVSSFPGLRCECGHISRGKSSQLEIGKRKALLRSVAR